MIHHKQQQASSSSESGFTIIESLVAIIVASILLSAIAPVIVLSVATRVQAKRIETAADAAKSYIDGIRSGQIKPPSTTGTAATDTLDNYDAPTTTGTITCNDDVSSDVNGYCNTSASEPTAATDLYCMNLDDNGGCSTSSIKDYIIQAFRYGGTVTTGGTTTTITDATQGYQLAVRVYRADAFAETGTLKKAKTDPKQNTFAAGVGDRKSPLIEMTTEITNTSTTFDNFCDRLRNPERDPDDQC